MGKLVAVWGTPNSGKTTVAIKLANALNTRQKKEAPYSVITLFCDLNAPVIPCIFPNMKKEEIFSVGGILVKTDISRNVVFSSAIFLKDKQNLAFLGYTDGENKFSYPALTEQKVIEFYEILKESADFVVVDCVSLPEDNMLTHVALKKADVRINLSTPSLKCCSFHLSGNPIFMRRGYISERDIRVMNVKNAEAIPIAADMKSTLGNIKHTISYSSAVREQTLYATLHEEVRDKKFNVAVFNIMTEVKKLCKI